MPGPRIALLNASHDHPDTRRNFRRELDANLDEYDVTAGEIPRTLRYDGVVVTGSSSSVYWDESWIGPTASYVAKALDEEIPTLGVCWGHQLLADVVGGRVVPMDAYEIGYREISRSGTSALLDGIDRRFLAFTTHSDEVASLPPDAEVIAENDVSIQGFTRGSAYGVQFHPEYDAETARTVTREKDALSPERKEAVLAGITPSNERAAARSKRVFDNFLGIVE